MGYELLMYLLLLCNCRSRLETGPVSRGGTFICRMNSDAGSSKYSYIAFHTLLRLTIQLGGCFRLQAKNLGVIPDSCRIQTNTPVMHF